MRKGFCRLAKILDWPLPPPPEPPVPPKCSGCGYVGPFRMMGGLTDKRGLHLVSYALECPQCHKVFIEPAHVPFFDPPPPTVQENGVPAKSRKRKGPLFTK